MVYYPDNKACLGDLDVDTLDVFYLRNYHKKLGYDEIKQCWWQVLGKFLDLGFIGSFAEGVEYAWAYLDKWQRDAWTRSAFSHKPKLDSICNNACEVFNVKIKDARAKPIITLLEEVRMFVMRTIAKNKVKLNNHTGVLTPVIKSRLEKVRKESKSWKPIWTGDNGYEKFEVHGHPTNHVVDLGKRLCTCQFWMLTGIPCVHACAALSRVNKPPEDFCHRLLTMESYRKTYNYHINPISGQPLWEHAEECNRPHAPKIKRKPGTLQMKRWMDADEKGGGGSKKSKANPKTQSNNGDNVHLKRQLGPFTCSFCGDKGHTKRDCKKKRACDAAAAAEANKKKKNEGGAPASEQQLQQPQDNGNQHDGEDNPLVQSTEIGQATSDAQPVEIDISQPTASDVEDSQKDHGIKRPSKLSPRRKTYPLATSVPVNPMQGASSGTATKLVNYMKFIPTPGFKAPRKKN